MKRHSKRTILNIFGTPFPSYEIFKWKSKVILEKAKRLSVNLQFLGSISKIRDKWHIETWNGSVYEMSPFLVLYNCTRHLSGRDQEILEHDMNEIADTYYLDKEFDYGLIILALCIGLTPDIIINRWDYFSAIATASADQPNYLVVDMPQDYEDVIKDYLEVIASLVQQISEYHGNAEIPQYIESSLLEKEFMPQEGSNLDLDWDGSKKRAVNDHTLFIRIGPYTRLEHISMMWPMVEEEQSRLWDVPEQGYRIWKTYERDVFIWQKVREEHMTYDKAYDHWLDEHLDEDPVNISVIIKAVRKIDKINE